MPAGDLEHSGAESLERNIARRVCTLCDHIVKFIHAQDSCALKAWRINFGECSIVEGEAMLQTVGGGYVRAHNVTRIADLRRHRVAAGIWRIQIAEDAGLPHKTVGNILRRK